ncbi:hypothetical protein DL93DRAFT_2226498 [Clavulina sp. PMI_390]|nr:hypothetical protein DL93DRAFT_2226498 [Clavulina sp. PMI_390]
MSTPQLCADSTVRSAAVAPNRSAQHARHWPNPWNRVIKGATADPHRLSRKKTIIIPVGGLGDPSSRGCSAYPEPLKLNSRRSLYVVDVLEEFAAFQQDLISFCHVTAHHLSYYKDTPPHSTTLVTPQNDPITKPARDFSSIEEFICFALLSILSSRLYDDIFFPFHPCASSDDNQQREEEYRNLMDDELQPRVAAWRANAFNDIERNLRDTNLDNLLDRISGSVLDELTAALHTLPGELPLLRSNKLSQELKALITRAYNWNRSIKVDVLTCDLEVFLVEPSSDWDPFRMGTLDPLRSIGSGARVVSLITLGVISSVSLEGMRVSHVQQKALVLVDEWFVGKTYGRHISNVDLLQSLDRLQPIAFSDQTSRDDIFLTAYHVKGCLLVLSMVELCFRIKHSPYASNTSFVAELVWYRGTAGVKHEFLLAKICGLDPSTTLSPNNRTNQQTLSTREETFTVWARLDRRAKQSHSLIKGSSGMFPADDTVMLCSSREVLERFSGSSSIVQATMIFCSTPSLGDLGNLLSILIKESPHYNLINVKLVPPSLCKAYLLSLEENCYFFCSVIQQILRERHECEISGTTLHDELSPDTRERIRASLDLLHPSSSQGDCVLPISSRASEIQVKCLNGWLAFTMNIFWAFW